jgi:hypothetical protein
MFAKDQLISVSGNLVLRLQGEALTDPGAAGWSPMLIQEQSSPDVAASYTYYAILFLILDG